MYFFKKLVSRFLFPVPLCAELLLLGLILLLFTRRQKLAKALLAASAGLLLAISFPWLPVEALRPLERTFPPLTDPARRLPTGATNVFIAVLGQGVSSDAQLPANQRFNEEFVTRLLEAGRLRQRLPEARLLVSVSGETIEPEEKRRVLAEFFGLMGIASNQITLVAHALDSRMEIQAFREMAGTNPVVLVSSACHLPRAMLLAEDFGLRAVPAPSGYFLDFSEDKKSPYNPSSLFPSAENLRLTERAIYERLGLWFERLRRRTPRGG